MPNIQFDIYEWTRHMFERYTPKFSYQGETGHAFIMWQERFRAELKELLGLNLLATDGFCDLAPKLLSSEEFDEEGYVRQKWTIQTEPGYIVPFYLLLPKKADKKIPLILAVHGHSASGKEIYVGNYTNEKEHRSIVEEERDIAVQAVKHGYAAIAPDMRAFGELTNHHDPKYGWIYCRSLQMHAQLFGRTLIGERVWDVGRLIDFAETIPCIDMSRIAITGNSGGGTVSLFTAATDTRIALAAPSCYFCTFQHSIAADIPHCECNFIPGIATLGEMWDIAGLVVPRPFLAIAGQTDHWFPIEATKEAFEKLKKIYANNGADDKCELYIGDGGHRYYKDGAWKFIRRYFG